MADQTEMDHNYAAWEMKQMKTRKEAMNDFRRVLLMILSVVIAPWFFVIFRDAHEGISMLGFAVSIGCIVLLLYLIVPGLWYCINTGRVVMGQKPYGQFFAWLLGPLFTVPTGVSTYLRLRGQKHLDVKPSVDSKDAETRDSHQFPTPRKQGPTDPQSAIVSLARPAPVDGERGPGDVAGGGTGQENRDSHLL